MCPLPQGQLAEREVAEAFEALARGEVTLSPVLRASDAGTPQLIAAGYACQVLRARETQGESPRGTARRLVGRSLRQAKASEAALRARVAQAQVEALKQRGRGRKRFAEMHAVRQAVHEVIQRHQGEDVWWRRDAQHYAARPRSLTPMSVQRDAQAPGRMRLLSIALRVLTLLAFVGRRPLALEEGKLAGLSAGNPKRETARPTAERCLETFGDITLTVFALPQQTIRHVTPLRALQRRMREIVGFSAEVDARLEAISVDPP